MLALVLGYLLFSWGSWKARAELELASRAAELKTELAQALEAQVHTLQADNARLQRTLAIDASARASLEQRLLRQREKLGRLREEAAFYRTLALPVDDARTASTLIEFRLYDQAHSQRRYRFSIWVARVRTDAQHTSAALALKVLGRRHGQALELEAAALGQGARVENFSFANFHRLDGVLSLPQAFEPEAVALELTLQGESSADDRIVRIFPWAVPRV